MIRQTITDQKEATRLGLQFLQIGANVEGVQEIFKARNEEAAKAMAEYQRGLSLPHAATLHGLNPVFSRRGVSHSQGRSQA